MAEKRSPLVSLTDDARKHLSDMDGEIKAAESNLDSLESIGLDVSVLREKIAWAKKAKVIIQKQFE